MARFSPNVCFLSEKRPQKNTFRPHLARQGLNFCSRAKNHTYREFLGTGRKDQGSSSGDPRRIGPSSPSPSNTSRRFEKLSHRFLINLRLRHIPDRPFAGRRISKRGTAIERDASRVNNLLGSGIKSASVTRKHVADPSKMDIVAHSLAKMMGERMRTDCINAEERRASLRKQLFAKDPWQ